MLSHARVTLMETFIGLFFGILTGFFIGGGNGQVFVIRKMIYPLIVVSQTIPTIAIAPLLVIWMGYKMLPKIVLIVLVVFFPIAISLLEGFSSVEPDTVSLMRSMGATRADISLRQTAELAWSFLLQPENIGFLCGSQRVVSEWIGGTEGLGCYMTRVRKSYASDKMFAVIILISVISLLLIWLTGVLQHLCMPWDKNSQNRSKKI